MKRIGTLMRGTIVALWLVQPGCLIPVPDNDAGVDDNDTDNQENEGTGDIDADGDSDADGDGDTDADEDCPAPENHGACEDAECACAEGYTGDACDQCAETNGGDETCDGLDNDCDGATDEGYDLLSDPENCGACGNDCAATPRALDRVRRGAPGPHEDRRVQQRLL